MVLWTRKEKSYFSRDIIKYINTRQKNLGFIIFSNSCDLENLKNKNVVYIAPIFPYSSDFNNMIGETSNRTEKKVETLKFSTEVLEYFTNLDSQYIYNKSN